MKLHKIVIMVLCSVSILKATDAPSNPDLTVTIDNQTGGTIYCTYCISSSINQKPIACFMLKEANTIETGQHELDIRKHNEDASPVKRKLLSYTRLFFSTKPTNETKSKDVASILLPQNANILCKDGIVFTVTKPDPKKNPDTLKVTDNCSVTGRVQKAFESKKSKAVEVTGEPKQSALGRLGSRAKREIKRIRKPNTPRRSYFEEEPVEGISFEVL